MNRPAVLRETIGFCRFDDCAIVLDIRADRYWQVSAALGDALAAVDRGESSSLTPATMARLSDLGLTDPASTPHDPRRPFVTPRRSALASRPPPGRIRPLLALEVVATTLAAIARLRWRGLEATVATMRDRRRSRRIPTEVDTAALARDFQRYRRWLPLKPVCLADSFAYLAFAARRGAYPDLVFGVEAHPFAAHCWVQADDVVLNDVLDHATLFAPIMRL